MPIEEYIMLLGVYREISGTLGLRERFNNTLWRKRLQREALEVTI